MKKGGRCLKTGLQRRTAPLAEESLLLLRERLLLGTLDVIVHMTVEPLGIVKRTLGEEEHKG